jgi:hypothetical protein
MHYSEDIGRKIRYGEMAPWNISKSINPNLVALSHPMAKDADY